MNYKFNLKESRKKKNLTQKDLADKTGIHQTNISDYEIGKTTPSLETLVQLAQALNMSLDELILYEKSHTEYSTELAKMAYKEKSK